jgi:opacity protein-like surface antigen
MNANARRWTAWGVLAAGLAWGGPAVHAETKPGQSLLDLGLGIGVPVSGLDLTRFGGGAERPGAAGFSINPRYLYQLRSHLAIGGELSYSNFPDRAVPLGGGFGTAGGSAFTMEGIARYLFDPSARVSPYLIGGLGFNNYSATVRSPGGNLLIDSSSAGLAMSAGAGVQADLSDQVVLSGEARWRLGTIDSGIFGTGVYNALDFLARVGWKF